MCFDSKAVDDPKRSSSIEFLQGEYCFCIASFCMLEIVEQVFD